MIQYDRLWATMTDRGMTQYKADQAARFQCQDRSAG